VQGLMDEMVGIQCTPSSTLTLTPHYIHNFSCYMGMYRSHKLTLGHISLNKNDFYTHTPWSGARKCK
jgi:hypothetical protein